MFPYVPVTKMVTVVLSLSPNCVGVADLSMQTERDDGYDLGASKVGSKEHQDGKVTMREEGRPSARREDLRSMSRDP